MGNWFLMKHALLNIVWSRTNIRSLVFLFMENQDTRSQLFIDSSCRFFWNGWNTTDLYLWFTIILFRIIAYCWIFFFFNIFQHPFNISNHTFFNSGCPIIKIKTWTRQRLFIFLFSCKSLLIAKCWIIDILNLFFSIAIWRLIITGRWIEVIIVMKHFLSFGKMHKRLLI